MSLKNAEFKPNILSNNSKKVSLNRLYRTFLRSIFFNSIHFHDINFTPYKHDKTRTKIIYSHPNPNERVMKIHSSSKFPKHKHFSV